MIFLSRMKKKGTIYCLECGFKLAELYICRRYEKDKEKIYLLLKIDGHYIPIGERYFSEIADMYKKIRLYWRRCPRCYRDLKETPQVLTLKKGNEKTTFVLYEGELVAWN